jgi:hypothetical protein
MRLPALAIAALLIGATTARAECLQWGVDRWNNNPHCLLWGWKENGRSQGGSVPPAVNGYPYSTPYGGRAPTVSPPVYEVPVAPPALVIPNAGKST